MQTPVDPFSSPPPPLSAPSALTPSVISPFPIPLPSNPPHPSSCVGRSPIGEIAIVDTDFGTHLIKVNERSDKFDPKKTKTDGGYSL